MEFLKNQAAEKVNGQAHVLTREEILGINDVQLEKMVIPEWGNGTIWVRSMTGETRAHVEASQIKQKGKDTNVNIISLRERVCVGTICDENGDLLFTQADIRELSKKNAAVLDRIVTVAYRLSGIDAEVVKELTEEMDADPSPSFVSG